MKLNKTICISEKAFKRSKEIDNFSKWIDDKLLDADGYKDRLLAEARGRRIIHLTGILSLNGIKEDRYITDHETGQSRVRID